MEISGLKVQLKELIEKDPDGSLAYVYLCEQKNIGLTKEYANIVLMELFIEYRDAVPETPRSEGITEAVACLLESVNAIAGQSDTWIYPRDQNP